jgi:hypothetical protein
LGTDLLDVVDSLPRVRLDVPLADVVGEEVVERRVDVDRRRLVRAEEARDRRRRLAAPPPPPSAPPSVVVVVVVRRTGATPDDARGATSERASERTSK